MSEQRIDSSLRIGQLVRLLLPVTEKLQEIGAAAEDKFRVYSSRVEDLLPEDLVVVWPTERAVLVPIVVGQEVTLQMGGDRGVLRLDSTILAKRHHPYPLLHISRAGDWSRSQMRHNVRLEVTIVPYEVLKLIILPEPSNGEPEDQSTTLIGLNLNGLAEANLQTERISAIIRDISAGGMLLASATPLQSGDLVKITFPLRQDQPTIAAVAKVVWTGSDNGPGKHRHKAGCQFLDLGVKEQDSITKFIFAKQVELRRSGML